MKPPAIRRREPVCTNWNFTVNPAVCVTWVQGWRCLRIDSSDYANPQRQETVVTSYASCAPQ